MAEKAREEDLEVRAIFDVRAGDHRFQRFSDGRVVILEGRDGAWTRVASMSERVWLDGASRMLKAEEVANLFGTLVRRPAGPVAASTRVDVILILNRPHREFIEDDGVRIVRVVIEPGADALTTKVRSEADFVWTGDGDGVARLAQALSTQAVVLDCTGDMGRPLKP